MAAATREIVTEVPRPAKPVHPYQRDAEPVPPSWPSLAEHVDRAASEQNAVRLLTGFDTLDAIVARCGIPVGRGVTTMQGSPGAGKTGVAAQLARVWAEQGIPVAIFAGDEPVAGWIQRFAQQFGEHRSALERADVEAWARAKARIAPLPIRFVDPDEIAGVVVDDLVARLLAEFTEGPVVVFVDLAQTIHTRNSAGLDTDKRRLDAVMNDLKRLGKHPRVLMIVLSEVARGAYRSRKKGERTDPLASGKESGAIESRSSMLLDFSSVEGGAGSVDVYAAKTRFGRKDVLFRLALDHERCSYTEIPVPDGAAEEATSEEVARGRIRKILSVNTTLQSANDVYKAIGKNRKAVLKAVKDLLEEGEIARVGGYLRWHGGDND